MLPWHKMRILIGTQPADFRKPEVTVRATPKADTGCQERIEVVLVNGRRVIVCRG